MTTVVNGDQVTVTVTWKTPGSSTVNSFISTRASITTVFEFRR